MEPELTSETSQQDLESDKKIAHISFQLLFLISLLHGVWLTLRNLKHITNVTNAPLGGVLVFLFVFSILLILNFIPVIQAKKLYKRGLYRKQIKRSIISFVVYQSILHIILFVLSRLLFATFC